MADLTHGDPTTLAARAALARNYQAIVDFLRHRAHEGDVVARGFERALTYTFLPLPDQVHVRRWLAEAAAEPRLFNRASDPWVARDLLAQMNALETRAPGLAASVWAEVWLAARSTGQP